MSPSDVCICMFCPLSCLIYVNIVDIVCGYKFHVCLLMLYVLHTSICLHVCILYVLPFLKWVCPGMQKEFQCKLTNKVVSYWTIGEVSTCQIQVGDCRKGMIWLVRNTQLKQTPNMKAVWTTCRQQRPLTCHIVFNLRQSFIIWVEVVFFTRNIFKHGRLYTHMKMW